MKAINDHFYSLKRSITLLLKGHFLVFFIPGLVIALIFFFYLLTIDAVGGVLGLLTYTPWIGSYMGLAVDSVYKVY